MEKNLTTGSVGRQLIGFSLPYLLSYLLQTLYGMADLFIIGQYEGVAGTTAVAVGSQVMYMLTVMIVGLAMGTTVSIARAIGADDRPQGRRGHGQYGDAVSVALARADGRAAAAPPPDHGRHVDAGGGGRGDGPLSDDLFSWHSVHYGV